jgi:hypothetical protein
VETPHVVSSDFFDTEYMETTPQAVTSETSNSHFQPRRISLGKVAAGFVFAGLVLLGSAFSASVAGAAVVHPKALHHAQVAALDSVVANRLNAIRSSFGLQTGALTSSYNTEVSQAVALNEDPPFAPTSGGVVGEEGLWGVVPGVSGASAQAALEIVNGWVYHDGWDGSVAATWNADCTSAQAAGCNGHRRNVLSTPPVAGAKLTIDVTTQSVIINGQPALAVAALFVWKTATA